MAPPVDDFQLLRALSSTDRDDLFPTLAVGLTFCIGTISFDKLPT